MSNKSCGTGNQ